MLEPLHIPGFTPPNEPLRIRTVFANAAALAIDGEITVTEKSQIKELGTYGVDVVLVCSGPVPEALKLLTHPTKVLSIPEDVESEASYKLQLLQEMEPKHCVVIGCGRSDIKVLGPQSNVALRFAVCDRSGCAPALLNHAHLVFSRWQDAIDVILHRERLVAALRGCPPWL